MLSVFWLHVRVHSSLLLSLRISASDSRCAHARILQWISGLAIPALRIRWVQQIAVIYALYGVDLDSGLLVSREGNVGTDEERLCTVSDIEGAIEAHGLHTAFLASGLVERVGKADGIVINLIGQMRRQQSDS